MGRKLLRVIINNIRSPVGRPAVQSLTWMVCSGAHVLVLHATIDLSSDVDTSVLPSGDHAMPITCNHKCDRDFSEVSITPLKSNGFRRSTIQQGFQLKI
jgi:hypothetical protein